MKTLVRVLSLAVLMGVVVTSVNAQAPIQGEYKTSLGDMFTGRESTSWPGGGPAAFHTPGNVVNLQSWDGAALGTEWYITCPEMFTVNVIDNRVAGSGQVIATINYTFGGTIWLDGAGAWGNGDAFYAATINAFTETRVYLYLLGNLQGVDSDYTLDATFNGYSSTCVQLLANGAYFDDTDNAALPLDWPAFLDSGCNAGPTEGRWGQIDDMTMNITACVVPVEEKSWGAVKSLYTE